MTAKTGLVWFVPLVIVSERWKSRLRAKDATVNMDAAATVSCTPMWRCDDILTTSNGVERKVRPRADQKNDESYVSCISAI
jgi:hypothetical protein